MYLGNRTVGPHAVDVAPVTYICAHFASRDRAEGRARGLPEFVPSPESCSCSRVMGCLCQSQEAKPESFALSRSNMVHSPHRFCFPEAGQFVIEPEDDERRGRTLRPRLLPRFRVKCKGVFNQCCCQKTRCQLRNHSIQEVLNRSMISGHFVVPVGRKRERFAERVNAWNLPP